MGSRSLAQVLLGMLGFVLAIELFTAGGGGGIGNSTVEIAGMRIGALPLLLVLIADIAALVAVSRSGRGLARYRGRDDTPRRGATRSDCTRCGWTNWAPTIEEARYQGQQHLHEAHGGPPPPAAPHSR